MATFVETFTAADNASLAAATTDLDWSDVASGWSVASNRAALGSTGAVAYARAEHDTGSADMAVEATLIAKGDAGGDFSQFAVLARFSASANTCYMLCRGQDTPDDITLRRTVAGGRANIATATVPYTGAAERLRLEVVGNQLRGYVNGALVISATDSNITTGQRGGLYAFRPVGGAVVADNFHAEALPSFVSAGTFLSGASSTTAAIAAPANTQAEDVVLLFLYKESTSAVPAPTDFALCANLPIATTAGVHNLHVYWKRCTGTESGTYSLSWTGSAWRDGVAVAFRGCALTGNPIEITTAAQVSTSGTNVPDTAGTTTGPNRLLVLAWTNPNAGIPSLPSGFTLRAGGTGGVELAVSTKAQATAGSTGATSGSWDNSSGSRAAYLLALVPQPPTIEGQLAGSLDVLATPGGALVEPAGVNLCPNPAADVDLTGWSGPLGLGGATNNQTAAVERVTGLLAFDLPKDAGFKLTLFGFARSAPAAVEEGVEYTISYWGRASDFDFSTGYLVWYAADGSDLDYVNTGDWPGDPNVTARKTATATAPAGAVAVGIIQDGGPDSILTAVMVEPGPLASDYRDGESSGWTWDGTAGLSASSGEDPPPIAIALRLSGQLFPGGDAEPETTDSFTPGAGEQLVVTVAGLQVSGNTDPSGDFSIVDSQGLTWTEVATVGTDAFWSAGARTWISSPAEATSMTITFDCGARPFYDFSCVVLGVTGASGEVVGLVTDGDAPADGAYAVDVTRLPGPSDAVIFGRLVDNDGSSTGIVLADGWTVTQFSAFATAWQVGPPSTTIAIDDTNTTVGIAHKAIDWAFVLKAGEGPQLLGAWSFDEASGAALDESGNGNDIDNFGFGALTRVTGRTGSGITGWPGSSVTLLDPPIGQTAARTLMFWAKLDGVTGFIQFEDGDGFSRWGIDKGQGNVRVSARDSNGLTRAEIPALATGAWHHYAGTYADGALSFYVDGELVATNTLDGPILTDATRIVVGQYSTGAETHVFDDLRIYDYALTAEEIIAEGEIPDTVEGQLAGGLPPLAVPGGTAAATVTATGQLGGTLSRSAWTVTADSEETVNETPAAVADRAIDGDPATFWHTRWREPADPLPHTFTIDMHATMTVTGLRYLPRGAGANGNIGDYRVETSPDGTTWTARDSGTWDDFSADEKTATWAPVAVRYVRLIALSGAFDGPWTAAAEIGLVAGDALPGLAGLGGQLLASAPPLAGVLAGGLPVLAGLDGQWTTARPASGRWSAGVPSVAARWSGGTPTRPARWHGGAPS